MNKIAITTGDPNGIGAEITIKALNALDLPEDEVVLISNKRILDFYGKLNRNYEIIEIPFDAEIEPGIENAASGEFSFSAIKKACEIKPKAIVTAPVSKAGMYMAGHKFSGQTEVLQMYLAHGEQKAEMFFVADDFRVLLLTRHCALKDVKITKDLVINKVHTLLKYLPKNPKIALCALNPHAGEEGVLGNDEIDEISPAVEELRGEGINITKPLPADTLFIGATQAYIKKQKVPYDCYVACYHDQGLIPIKSVAAEKTVNMTIGLDIVRTSPSHGTAFDIAGQGIASELSMIEAIKVVL